MSETIEAQRARYHARDLVMCGSWGAVTGLLDLSAFMSDEDIVARLHVIRARHGAEMAKFADPDVSPIGAAL